MIELSNDVVSRWKNEQVFFFTYDAWNIKNMVSDRIKKINWSYVQEKKNPTYYFCCMHEKFRVKRFEYQKIFKILIFSELSIQK